MPAKEWEIVSAANARLKKSPYATVRRLSCEMTKGDLILHGRVSTFFEKQQAQEAVRRVEGVSRIINEITVHS